MDELSNLVYVHNPFLFTELIESESPAERFYGLFNLAVGKLTNRCFSAHVKTIYACNSKYTANLLNKFLNKYGKTNATITTLYPPVDVNHIKKKGKERIRQNAVVVLSRFHPKKKLEFSLFVAKEVVKKIPQAKFYLIGSLNDAHYYSYLKTLALKLGLHRHVSFLADVSEEVKATLMHSAKVYLHTMPYEHFGISIVEGMSAGLCPIVHDSGGAKEFVDSKYRYTNLTEAVEKVTYYLENWNYEDSEKLKSKAQLFDRTNFEANFLKILKKLM
jgi:glycosyltransferase involved in cell wall biosynthesis